MPYCTKKQAIDAITCRTKTVKGKEYTTYEVYLGVNPITGKQVRLCRSNEADVKKAVEAFYNGLRRAGDAGATLSASQSYDALQAYRALSEAKIDISLYDCVRKLIEYRLVGTNKPAEKTVGDAFDEYLETFTLATANKKTVSSRVGRWTIDFGRERVLTEVTEKEVLSWISSNYDNPKTYNNHFTYIRTFFNWCMEKNKRYLLENPLECAKLRPVQAKRPEFMPSKDVCSLLFAIAKETDKPEILAYAIASFFCGIRREEIIRASENDENVIFDIPHKTVTVIAVKGYTQGRHPRSFPMSDAFAAWASWFDFNSAIRKVSEHVTNHIRRIAKENGITLPKNAGRHTYITQMLALTHDVGKVGQYAGTSPQMIKDHYNGLSFEEDATAHFAIRPPSPAVD